MAEIKDAFVCYRSYIEAIELLPENKRWAFFEKIVAYALDGVEPDLVDNDTKLAFTLMKANLDSCDKRYKTSIENGKKGGRPRKEYAETEPKKNLNKNLKKPNQNPNDNVNVNVTLSSVSEGGGLTTSPPPRNGETSGEEQFQMGGEWYEYYIAEDGERRVRKIDR